MSRKSMSTAIAALAIAATAGALAADTCTNVPDFLTEHFDISGRYAPNGDTFAESQVTRGILFSRYVYIMRTRLGDYNYYHYDWKGAGMRGYLDGLLGFGDKDTSWFSGYRGVHMIYCAVTGEVTLTPPTGWGSPVVGDADYHVPLLQVHNPVAAADVAAAPDGIVESSGGLNRNWGEPFGPPPGGLANSVEQEEDPLDIEYLSRLTVENGQLKFLYQIINNLAVPVEVDWQAAELAGTIQPGQTLSRSFLSSSDAMLVDGSLSLAFEEDPNNGEPDFRFGFDGPATAWVVVPEPSTAAVIVLGALLLRRRKGL